MAVPSCIWRKGCTNPRLCEEAQCCSGLETVAANPSAKRPEVPLASKTVTDEQCDALLDALGAELDGPYYRGIIRRWLETLQVETKSPLQTVVYSHCPQHYGVPATLQVSYGANVRVICPLCEPPSQLKTTPRRPHVDERVPGCGCEGCEAI